MEKNIKLTLLDNGIDYIYAAVKPMLKKTSQSKDSWKYSVLHLYSGIQLLLKERLKQEHWSLIFQKTEEANPEKLVSGDFVSVYHDVLIKRLKNIIPNFNFNDEPIKKLQSLRNKIEHFEVNIALSECQYTVALALDEIIKFWESDLKINSTVKQQQKFQKIKSIATEFKAYRKQRLDKFKKEIDSIETSESGLRVLCPDCSSLSFVVFKNDIKECQCFVCDKKYNKHDYLQKIRGLESDEPYDPICSACQKETRTKYLIKDGVTLYCCLNCLKYELIDIEFEENFRQLKWIDIITMQKHNYTIDEFYELQLDKQRQMYLGKE
jgi:ribosomal protein S27E